MIIWMAMPICISTFTFIMAKLGAPLNSLEIAIALISSDKDDTYSTHPALSKRLNYIEKGFNQSIEAKGDYELPFTKEEYYRLALQDMIDNKYYAAIDKLSLSIALYKKEPTDQDVGLLRVYATRAQAVEELEDYNSAINDYDFISLGFLVGILRLEHTSEFGLVPSITKNEIY